MLCDAYNSCCVRPTRGCPSTRHDPVLHDRAAPPLLCERVSPWPDALLGPPALGHERMAVCSVWLGSRLGGGRCNLYASCLCCDLGSVSWLGSRFRDGRCNLYALTFVPCLMLCSFSYLVSPCPPPLSKIVSFFSWNVRGLGQSSRCDDILSELISTRPSIAAL